MSRQANPCKSDAGRAGFTLPELMLSLGVSLLVFTGLFAGFSLNRNGWLMATATVQSSSAASMTIERIVYGMGGRSLRAQRAADVELITDLDDEDAWLLRYEDGTRWIGYDAASQVLVNENDDILGRDVAECRVELREGGFWIDLTVQQPGRFQVSTSRMRSYVRFRN